MKRSMWPMMWLGMVLGMTAGEGGLRGEPVVATEVKLATEVSVDVAAVLRDALKEKRVVAFLYQGHARTVEPHALGKGSGDNRVLLAWQTAGGNQTDSPPGWRVFQVAEIKELKRTETVFEKARADYQSRRGGRGLKSIEAEVAVK